MIELNGMAHVMLTVSQFDKSRAFYSELLPYLGMQLVFDGADFCYHVGADLVQFSSQNPPTSFQKSVTRGSFKKYPSKEP